MSPLGEAIYHVLARRVGLGQPLISYHELVVQLPPLASPHDNITRNDERLFKALGEVGIACQEWGFPALTALVIRSAERSPGSGYYHLVHPETGDDPEKRKAAWERELAKVKATQYPPNLAQDSSSKLDSAADVQQRSRPLGHLQVAMGGSKPSVVFIGHVTCRRCSSSVAIEVERNANAVSAKQPAFLVVEAGTSSHGRPIGHLFIGTILSSPVLYYGSVNHCDPEQRVAVFYNRALRDRTDSHLTIMPSTSAGTSSSTGEADVFRLS